MTEYCLDSARRVIVSAMDWGGMNLIKELRQVY